MVGKTRTKPTLVVVPVWELIATKPLSDQHVQILQAMADNKSQKQIAHEQGIVVNTVKNHLNSIYRRLGVNQGTAAISWAFRNGVIV